MSKKQSKSNADNRNSQTVCRNRKAHHEYEILEEMECGIVLVGSEVKSARNGKVSIDEGYVRVQGGELWLIGCNIAEYPQATVMNHDPLRKRKLLVHKRQFHKFAESATQKGFTMIPLAVYFSRGIVKIKIAVARGRKLYDKRQKLRKASDKQEIRRIMLKNQ